MLDGVDVGLLVVQDHTSVPMRTEQSGLHLCHKPSHMLHFKPYHRQSCYAVPRGFCACSAISSAIAISGVVSAVSALSAMPAVSYRHTAMHFDCQLVMRSRCIRLAAMVLGSAMSGLAAVLAISYQLVEAVWLIGIARIVLAIDGVVSCVHAYCFLVRFTPFVRQHETLF